MKRVTRSLDKVKGWGEAILDFLVPMRKVRRLVLEMQANNREMRGDAQEMYAGTLKHIAEIKELAQKSGTSTGANTNAPLRVPEEDKAFEAFWKDCGVS